MFFASSEIRDKEGRRFSIKSREWQRDQLWAPVDGYKLWPNNWEKLCAKCSDQANLVVEWGADVVERCKKHKAKNCDGLSLQPIILTVLNLPRREGKTFGTCSYMLSTIFQERHKSIMYVASAQDQTSQLFEENLQSVIRQNKRLTKASTIVGNKIYVPKNHSFLEHVATSHKSITGRGRSHLIIDEARDVAARVAMAAIPSVFDSHGLECPRGHMHMAFRKNAPKKCKCGALLQPWYGRIVIMSSSGLLEGGENDWFADLVEKLEEDMDPNAHVFRMDKGMNPNISKTSTTMVDRIFGDMDATRHYVEIEVHNKPTRKGEDFVSVSQINAIVDPDLKQAEGSDRDCVAFLDTSLSQDLTNLVFVMDDDNEPERPWHKVFVGRIDIWAPKKIKAGIIDPAAIQDHLDYYVPLFPNIRRLLVDVRAMPWAVELVKYCRTARPGWGKKVEAFHGQMKERDLSWNLLEQRILDRRIRIPDNKILVDEMKAVRRVIRPDNTVEIRDRNRKKRHADIAESLAACCYLVYLEQTVPRVSLRTVTRDTKKSDILRRVWRPTTTGLGPNSY